MHALWLFEAPCSWLPTPRPYRSTSTNCHCTHVYRRCTARMYCRVPQVDELASSLAVREAELAALRDGSQAEVAVAASRLVGAQQALSDSQVRYCLYCCTAGVHDVVLCYCCVVLLAESQHRIGLVVVWVTQWQVQNIPLTCSTHCHTLSLTLSLSHPPSFTSHSLAHNHFCHRPGWLSWRLSLHAPGQRSRTRSLACTSRSPRQSRR